MIPVIVAVHVDNGKWVDVPITPDTKCQDVVDCCREPSDEQCHLVHSVGLVEQVVPEDTYMMDILSRWGHNWPAVTFHLQYSEPVGGGHHLGTHQFPQAPIKDFGNWKKQITLLSEFSELEL
ncbi:hypothetical protein JTE90_020119 [Oedothorax gibbosus]|uniref:Ras association domain-containing protein n=1 Tax=Oedothorax gibbosus TaxID=931172 RepID=A0AAV6VMC3_9ARAC|nr:hypothetical protein JTE90_020119 [Oedothorax gibbosus]